jgi:hypothetical protein
VKTDFQGEGKLREKDERSAVFETSEIWGF